MDPYDFQNMLMNKLDVENFLLAGFNLLFKKISIQVISLNHNFIQLVF